MLHDHIFFMKYFLKARCTVLVRLDCLAGSLFPLIAVSTSILFRPARKVYRGCYDILRSSTYGSAEVLSSVRCELILIGLPLPLMHQLILSLLGIGSLSGRFSGINFGGIQFLYLTDEK